MSLPEEAPSEIGSVSSPRGFTVLPASRLSDSDNSIDIPVRQVATESSRLPTLTISHYFSNLGIGGLPTIGHLPAG